MRQAVAGDLGRIFTNGAAVRGLAVAGKSGTAELDPGRSPHSWFIGFAPYDDPQVAIAVLVATWRRATLASWVRDVPAMRAALIGAVVATIVATLANDSGALLLEIGAAYLLVFLGWAWAEAGRKPLRA